MKLTIEGSKEEIFDSLFTPVGEIDNSFTNRIKPCGINHKKTVVHEVKPCDVNPIDPQKYEEFFNLAYEYYINNSTDK